MKIFTKKYKFTDKKISRGGVMSSLFAVMALILVGMGGYISYKAKGNGGMNVGALGLGAFVVSIVGFFVGMRSFKRDDVFLGLPWFGVIANVIILLFMMCIILIGI